MTPTFDPKTYRREIIEASAAYKRQALADIEASPNFSERVKAQIREKYRGK